MYYVLLSNDTSPSKPQVIHVKINATAVRDVEQAYIKLFKCMSEIVDENSLQHSGNRFAD